MAGNPGFAGVSNHLVLEVFIMTKAKPKKKPGINQRIGKRRDDIADLDQRCIKAAHDVDNLRRELKRVKSDQIESRYVGPRMYQRERYGK